MKPILNDFHEVHTYGK